MIYRQLIEDLTEWSRRGNRKPLVLRGARQVGKTTLVDEFSKQYDCYIKLNLEQSADAKAFSISDDVAEIFQYLCLQKKIVVDKTSALCSLSTRYRMSRKQWGCCAISMRKCRGCTSSQPGRDFRRS